jgi:hypothetical protein
MILIWLACAPDEEAVTDCGDPADTAAFVATSLSYLRAADGVSQGFDIDGTDDDVCGIDDFTDPDGLTGIDNGFAALIPALELTEANVVEGLLNASILNGQLMLAVEISRVDDLWNDDCVDVTVLQADGDPLLGTDGGLIADQSLARNPDTPTSTLTGARIVDGRLRAWPMDFSLPLQILDVLIDFDLGRGGVELALSEDGAHTGFYSGAVPREEFMEILENAGTVDETLDEVVGGFIDLALDLTPEGEADCTEMSAGFAFDAVDIYLVD